ncbi:hypothetical protein KQI84_07650 [bacterium]|nr:hypothetical protein [bacterium]
MDVAATPPNDSRWNRRLAFLAVLAGLVVFLPGLWNEFIYDDQIYITENPWIRSWDNLEMLLTTREANGLSGYQHVYWRPLRNLSYLIDYSIAGLSPLWFHLVNLLWHGAAVFGLFLLVRRMGLDDRVAFLAALLFAVHPVQSESVLWAKERDGLMGSALLIWAIWAMLGSSWKSSVSSVLLLIAALLSKEHTVVFPALALAALWSRWRAGLMDSPALKRALTVIGVSIPFVLVYLFFRSQVVGMTAQIDRPMGGTFPVTMWTMLGILVRYIGLIVFPAHLRITYSYIQPSGLVSPLPFIGIVLIAAMAWAVWHFRNTRPGISAGLIWFAAALVPFSNLIPMIQWMAVRFLYLPLAGVALILAIVVVATSDRLANTDRPMPADREFWQIAALILFIILGGLSLNRGFAWQNTATFWTDAYNTTPDTRETMVGYAQVALSAGRPEEALEVLANYPYYENPESDEEHAWALKASALEALGRRDEAIAVVSEGMRLLPPSRVLASQYAWLQAHAGNFEEAENTWKYILEREPTYAPGWEGYAIVLFAEDRNAAGQEALGRAKALQATPANQWGSLDLALDSLPE